MTIWFGTFHPQTPLTEGANDSVLPGRLQHVPLDRYKANLVKLIQFIKDPSSKWYSPDTRLVLITAPPIIPEDWLKHCVGMWEQNGSQGPKPTEIDREPENTKRYVEACIQVAKEQEVEVVDAWSAIVDKAGGSDAKSLAAYF
jgi:lysophospholipase L1-like esterase